jgi:hypothetical protein
VPGTDDPTNIQGALRPLSLRIDLQGELLHTTTTTTTPPCDEKSAVSDVTVSKPLHSTKCLHFRDGDHSGEALLEEIVAGFEDGELSHHCQIFDTDMDEWIVVTVFLGNHGIGIPTEATSRQTAEGVEFAHCDNTKDALIGMADVDYDHGVVQYEEVVDELPLLDKNDKKKPARDSSNWGKGQLLPIDAIQNAPGEEYPNSNSDENVTLFRTKKVGHVKPPAKLMRTVTQAMIQWDMVEDGDRLLLGLSGGKDSLSLLHILLEFQRKLPIRFEIEVSAWKTFCWEVFEHIRDWNRTHFSTTICFACRFARWTR